MLGKSLDGLEDGIDVLHGGLLNELAHVVVQVSKLQDFRARIVLPLQRMKTMRWLVVTN